MNDDKCFTTREIEVHKYIPDQTLVLCNNDAYGDNGIFVSNLKSPIESYYKSEPATNTKDGDITEDQDINDDDWLVVQNSGSASSTIGIWQDSTSSVDHLWKTTQLLLNQLTLTNQQLPII